MYDALNHGPIDVESLRRQLAGLPLPRAAGGRLVLAVDVSPWLRPDGNCSPQRSFCHTYGRGKDEHRMIPGWPYSIVAALETGRTSWTALLDAVRLPPAADVTTITCAQIRQLVDRLTDAGQWQAGDRDFLIVLDAGYEAPRIAWLLRDLPVEILGRMRSDRVLRRATPPRVYQPLGGRPAKHGGEFVFGDPATWDTEHAVTQTGTRLYGQVRAQAWDRLHPRLTRRAAWIAQDLRRPWERPMAPERLTPARVRRGFRNLRATSDSPARAPNPVGLAPDARQAPETGTPLPATTWGSSWSPARHTSGLPTTRKAPSPAELVKRQDETQPRPSGRLTRPASMR
jgi:hypothetical protein